jgi:short-subunit dehydrogenase
MEFQHKKILITGGSAGIGKALVEELVRRGATHLAIVGRRIQPLEEMVQRHTEINILPIQADIGAPGDIDLIVETVRSTWGELDILVNNAGVVSAGLLEEMSDDDIIQQIQINVTGLILLTKKFLPMLQASREAALINVSSGLGYIANPFYSVYAATKAAVRQFSDAMRRELYEYPIHVMTIYPTATDTDMMKTAKVGRMDSPEMVAEKSLDGLEAGEINVIFGGEQRLKDIEENFLDPTSMDKKAVSRYAELKERTANHRAM